MVSHWYFYGFDADASPHSRNYQVTADGRSTALFFTRLTRRVIIPTLADLAAASLLPGGPLRQAVRAHLHGGDRRPRQPGLTRHPATIRRQAPLTSRTSRNTQPKLARPVKSLRGKITYFREVARLFGYLLASGGEIRGGAGHIAA